jgi:hypothetical protein
MSSDARGCEAAWRYRVLISDKHRKLYEQHYAAMPVPTKVRKHSWHAYIQKLVDELGAVDLLDYGSGPDRALVAHIQGCRVTSFDPGVPSLAVRVRGPFDLVVCSHTLEHAEEEDVSDLIVELRSLAGKALLIVVSLKPSTKVLPDGTPWHTCVHSADWWSNQFQDLWPIE